MSKTPDDAYALLEKMASNNYQWHGERNQPRKVAGVYEVDSLSMVNAKLDSLTNQLQNLNFSGYPSQVLSCEVCGGHSTIECQQGQSYSQGSSIEQLNALNNFNGRPQANPYSNTYNPGWRNHPNFSWSNQGGNQASNSNQGYKAPPVFQQKSTDPQPEPKSNLEMMMENFIQSQSKINQTLQEGFKQHQEGFKQHEENFKRLDARLDQLATHNKMLEHQIASQASSSNFRQMGHFPSQPENPKEHAKAVTLRSGKQLPEVEHKIEEKRDESK